MEICYNLPGKSDRKMKYRYLGKTGLQVSEIGFGSWGIGGSSGGGMAYGPTDDDESLGALRTAFESGINFYDTADIYGLGHSQQLIGKAFHHCRTEVVIASKVGFMNFAGEQDFSPRNIMNSVEASLKHLQTDYIDLYQLHNPPMDLVLKEDAVLNTLLTLKKQGKIRATGISVRSPDDGVVAVRQFDFEVIQVNFNLVDQRVLQNGLLELCDREKVGVIIRTPLCFGFLTGQYPSADMLDPLDHRRKWSRKQINKWANAYKIFVESLADREQSTNAQVALRFCLSYPGVSTVIPGMLTVEQVKENVMSSQQGELSKGDLLSIVARYNENYREWQQIDRSN